MIDERGDPEKQQGDFLKEFIPAREDLLAFIFALVPSHTDAENLFQEASVVLWQRFGSYTPGTNFKAWARKTIYNKVLNERTRTRREILWDPSVIEALDRAFEDREAPLDRMKDALEQCLRKLSQVNQAILQSRYHDGLPYRDIAERFKRSEQGIRVTFHKVRNLLADCVKHRIQTEVG